jgi:hypothetical protein
MLIYAASTSQLNQFNSTDITQQSNNFEHSQMSLEEERMATMTPHQEQSSQNGMANSGDRNNSITQQQPPPPSSPQQSYTFNSSEHIMANPNSPLNTMTPSIVMYVPITDTTTSTILHTSSDNNILEQAGEPEDNMNETRSLPHASMTVATPIIAPAIAGTLLTCRIEKNEKFRKTDGSTFETWILIDDQNRRYSQQKKNVPNIFQCTANVSTKDDKNKKCKGSIRIPDSHLPNLEELKKDPGKNVCTFTVGNAHEEHLPGKRGRQSTDTESEISSTSGKKKKKT